MSGGSGTRLWPLSRKSHPKQLLRLLSDRSLLQTTVERTAASSIFSAPLIVTGASHADEIETQLSEVGVTPERLILEPEGRNTAPAIALAALACPAEELLLVMPSDHHIANPQAFRAAIARGAELARDGRLVTFGIRPDHAETGYGYIRIGKPLGEASFEVDRFTEKPDREAAQLYVSSGDYLWNGGIFLFTAGTLLEALLAHAGDVHESVSAAFAEGSTSGLRFTPDPDLFRAVPNISIDYALMEKADRVAVVAVDMGWSDVGSWDSLNALVAPDEEGNRIRGETLLRQVRNCSLHSDGPIIVAAGVENLTIVATADAVLILPAGRSSEMPALVEALKARGSALD